MKKFKPMLASKIEDINKLVYPVLASPKLDGIRCVKIGGKALSRSLKPIPNDHIRKTLEAMNADNLDGEIIIEGKNFNEIQSAVMSQDGTPDFKYYVFDYIDIEYIEGGGGQSFDVRMLYLTNIERFPFVKLVPQTPIFNAQQLAEYEAKIVGAGYEGVMTRNPLGLYKFGRSTAKESYLMKLKRFQDSEAIIIDAVEQMHNTNEATIDELGHTERSTKKEGMIGAGMLGCLIVKDVKTGVQFEIGTGFNRGQRIDIWTNFICFKKLIVKYKYQELSADRVPRFPVFLGFRDKRDM